jgi:hypothetical protein
MLFAPAREQRWASAIRHIVAKRVEDKKFAYVKRDSKTVQDQGRRELPGLAHSSGIPALRRPSYDRSLISRKRGSPPLGTMDIW